MGFSLKKLGSQIFDQINPLDNGRTFQQRTPTNTRSVAQQVQALPTPQQLAANTLGKAVQRTTPHIPTFSDSSPLRFANNAFINPTKVTGLNVSKALQGDNPYKGNLRQQSGQALQDAINLTALLPVGKGAQLATKGAGAIRVGLSQGAKIGAGFGAAQGVATSNKENMNLKDTAKTIGLNTAIGGVGGGVLGGTIPAAGMGIKQAGKGMINASQAIKNLADNRVPLNQAGGMKVSAALDELQKKRVEIQKGWDTGNKVVRKQAEKGLKSIDKAIKEQRKLDEGGFINPFAKTDSLHYTSGDGLTKVSGKADQVRAKLQQEQPPQIQNPFTGEWIPDPTLNPSGGFAKIPGKTPQEGKAGPLEMRKNAERAFKQAEQLRQKYSGKPKSSAKLSQDEKVAIDKQYNALKKTYEDYYKQNGGFETGTGFLALKDKNGVDLYNPVDKFANQTPEQARANFQKTWDKTYGNAPDKVRSITELDKANYIQHGKLPEGVTGVQMADKIHTDKLAKNSLTQNEYAGLHQDVADLERAQQQAHQVVNDAVANAPKDASGKFTPEAQAQLKKLTDVWGQTQNAHLAALNRVRIIDGEKPITLGGKTPIAKTPTKGVSTGNPTANLSKPIVSIKTTPPKPNVARLGKAKVSQKQAQAPEAPTPVQSPVDSLPNNTPKDLKVRGFQKNIEKTLPDSPNAQTVAESIPGYKPITNKGTLKKAANAITENPQAEYARIVVKDQLTSADDVATGNLLLREAIEKGDMESAIQIGTKLGVDGTKLGQAVQAYATFKKTTPEGIVTYASKRAGNAGNELDPVLAQELANRAKAIADMPEGFEKAKATKELLGQADELGRKWTDLASEILNVPRAAMATADFSAPLRQGAILGSRFPSQFGKAFTESAKYMFKPDYYEKAMYELTQRPTYPLMKSRKLSVDAGENLTGTEEQFLGNILESDFFKKIGVGQVVAAADRAYSGFLTKIRADVFDKVLADANQSGVKLGNKELDSLAKYINSASGRGSGNITDQVSRLQVLFSARLWKSRLDTLNPAYYARLDPTARKYALQSAASFAGITTTLLSLAAASGKADVNADPRSADFGKIKVGNTRYDVLSGLQQNIRLAAQLATGEKINSETGEIQTLGADRGYGKPSRLDILYQFVENKENPVIAFGTKALRGTDPTGKPINLASEAAKLAIPLNAQSTYSTVKDVGSIPKGVAMNVPGTFGVGVQTYGDSKSKDKVAQEKLTKKEAAAMSPDSQVRWNATTTKAKKNIAISNPELYIKRQKEKAQKELEQGKTIEAFKDLRLADRTTVTKKYDRPTIQGYTLTGADFKAYVQSLNPDQLSKLQDLDAELVNKGLATSTKFTKSLYKATGIGSKVKSGGSSKTASRGGSGGGRSSGGSSSDYVGDPYKYAVSLGSGKQPPKPKVYKVSKGKKRIAKKSANIKVSLKKSNV